MLFFIMLFVIHYNAICLNAIHYNAFLTCPKISYTKVSEKNDICITDPGQIAPEKAV